MILIMGMPGAGKSVQSEKIRDELGFHWLSTGQLFRETNDPEIKKTMESGALVSDEQVSQMVGDKLKNVGYDSTFLLDGYPRTLDQAKWLIEHSHDIKKHVKLVLYMIVSPEVSASRLGDRGRGDDSEGARARRNKEAEKIKPTLEYLKDQGIPVIEVNADGSVDDVFEGVHKLIAEYIH